MSVKKEISRRDFLGIFGGAAAGIPFARRNIKETKEVEATSEIVPEWEELSPLTEAGGEYLGAVKERIEGGKINEIRAYKLPPNPEFKDSAFIAISSRLYPEGFPDDFDAVHGFGLMRLLELPSDLEPKPTPSEASRTLTFGNLELDIVQEEVGATLIWQTEFYSKGNKLDSYENPSFDTHVEHVGKSEIYSDKAFFFADENMHVLTPRGIEFREEQRTLVTEADGGRLRSAIVPRDLPEQEPRDITVVHAGDLTLIKGLTDTPFSYICQPEIIDGQGWIWAGQTDNKMKLEFRKFFLDATPRLEIEVSVEPGGLEELYSIYDKITSMWSVTNSYVVSERRLPFFTEEYEEKYLDIPVKKPEYNFYLIIEGMDGNEPRKNKIAIKTRKTQRRPRKTTPQLPREQA